MMLLAVLESSSWARVQGSSGTGEHIPFDSRKVVSEVKVQQGSDYLGNAFLVDSGFDAVPDTAEQTHLAVAFDGINYLVVWTTRSGVWGTRVDSAGRVIDPFGFQISETDRDSFSAVAFGTNCYLVAWVGYNCIRGKRISREGRVLDPTPITIADGGWPNNVSIAFGGASFTVVWDAQSINTRPPSHYYGISGAVVGEDGAVTANLIIRGWETINQRRPSITFGDSVYVFVWQRNSSVVGQFLHRDGANRDSMFTIVSNVPNEPHPTVAFGDTTYLVTWSYSTASIYGARIVHERYLPDTSGFLISDPATTQSLPVASYDGHNFLVAWQDYRDTHGGIHGRRVSEGGQLLDSASIRITWGRSYASRIDERVVHGAGNFLVLWQDYRNGLYQIYGSRVDGNGVVLDTEGLSMRRLMRSFRADDTAAVASDGTGYLVVWPTRESSYDSYNLSGVRVSRGGEIVDSSLIRVSAAGNYQGDVALAFGDSTYLVAWEDYRNGTSVQIYGARVTRSGRLLDSSGILVAPGYCRVPAVASDGSDFLAVWQSWRGSPASYDICAARLNESGELLDTPYVVVSGAPSSQDGPSVTFGAEDYLVTWRDSRSGSSQIYCARVTRSGQVLDTAGTPVSLLDYETAPSVAFDGTNFLVVWQNKPSGQRASALGARVNQDGILVDSTALMIAAAGTSYDELDPSATFDGRNYVVLWTRSGTDVLDSHGRRVTPSGELLDTFCIACGVGTQGWPSLAANSQCEVLVVYSGVTDSLYPYPPGAVLVWGRVGTLEGMQEPSAKGNPMYPLLAAPNPFRTVVSLHTIQPSPTRMRISDASGRTVMRIEARSSEAVWNGDDQNGMNLPPGVYFVQQEGARNTDCLKVIKLDR